MCGLSLRRLGAEPNRRTHRRHRPHISLGVAECIKTRDLGETHERLAATHLDVTLYSPMVSLAPACCTYQKFALPGDNAQAAQPNELREHRPCLSLERAIL